MLQCVLRGRRLRTPVVTRSLAGRAAGIIVAGSAVFAAPAAAQASAAAGPTVVPCSSSALVTAISQANGAGSATLLLSRGCTYALTTAAAPDDGLPPVTGNLLILGSGGTTISRSATERFRIFDVLSGGSLTLVNVTVANGNPGDDPGGGILDDGTVVLRNARLTGNTAAFGGGLEVQDGAHATVSFSQLDSNNTFDGSGGAIDTSGDLVVNHSG